MFPMLEEIVQCQRLDREYEAAERRFVAAAQACASSAPRACNWSERLQAIRRLIRPRVDVVIREVL
jgi:hypothetical protein